MKWDVVNKVCCCAGRRGACEQEGCVDACESRYVHAEGQAAAQIVVIRGLQGTYAPLFESGTRN